MITETHLVEGAVFFTAASCLWLAWRGWSRIRDRAADLLTRKTAPRVTEADLWARELRAAKAEMPGTATGELPAVGARTMMLARLATECPDCGKTACTAGACRPVTSTEVARDTEILEGRIVGLLERVDSWHWTDTWKPPASIAALPDGDWLKVLVSA